MRIVKPYLQTLLCLVLIAAASRAQCLAAEGLNSLVEQLQQADLPQRDALTARIMQLAAETDDDLNQWLETLSNASATADPDIAERFRQVRERVARRLIEQAGAPSTLSLDEQEISLADLLEKIEQQTGNRIVDLRDQWGQQSSPIVVVAKFSNEPFWSALDTILDQAELTPFRFGEGAALGLRSRSSTAAPRLGRAIYRGPFRIEVARVQAVRDLVQPTESGLVLVLDLAWEPRVEPIAVLQPIASLRVTTNDQERLAIDVPMEQLIVEPPPGSISTELAIPLELPDRSSIETLAVAGRFTAIVPARTADFRFTNLSSNEPVEQTEGNVTVVLDRVVERQGLWEFHLRLRLPTDVPGLESRVGWAYQNMTFLTHQDGEKLDHAGFETTSSKPGEIGLAYFFEIDKPLDEYTWVYQSPVNITGVRIDYELRNVPLP